MVELHGMRQMHSRFTGLRSERGRLQRGFKLGDIGRYQSRVKPHGRTIGLKEASRGRFLRFQLTTQNGECLLKAVTSHTGVGLRPEQLDKLLPRMLLVAVIGQIGQQRTWLLRL